MNRNLKNFPRTAEWENRDEADLWAEDFEKELRIHLQAFEQAQAEGASRTLIIWFTKEILGDLP